MCKKLLLIFLLVFPISVFSATSWTNGKQVIKHIIWKPNYHGFYVDSATYHDPNSCGDTSNLYLIDSSLDEKEVNRLYSMMLVAFSSGKKVHLWVTGCRTKFPTFNGLQVNY